MAWRYRWRWRRRAPRRRAGRFRYRFRRWRRLRPARKVRRRRRYRKRHFKKKAIKQWQPSHVARCIIRGWHIGFWGNKANLSYPFQEWTRPTKEGEAGFFTIREGGASLWHFNLSHFYREFTFGRNTWSRSNEGFDLATYHGTKLIFYPHPLHNYIVWWWRDFGDVSAAQFKHSHPAKALLERNHFVIKSIPQGGRKKTTIFIPPPTTIQTGWSVMKKWANVNLFRLGMTMINTGNPLLHKGRLLAKVPIGTYWSTGNYRYFEDRLPVETLPEASTNIAYYSWWWDDSQDNKIAIRDNENSNDGETIFHLKIPYWLEFFGAGDQYIEQTKKVYIWWYREDASIIDYHSITSEHRKQWIKLGNSSQGSISTALLAWSNIGRHGPFMMAEEDISNNSYSFFFKYKSYWRWGGVHPTPATNNDPVTVSPNSDDFAEVQVRNPLRVGRAALHPWDLDPDGFITTAKFRDMLGFSPSAITGLPPPIPQRRAKRSLSPSSGESEEEGPSVRRRRSGDGELEQNSFYFEEDTLPPYPTFPPGETAEEKIRALVEQLRRDRDKRRKLRKRIRSFLRD
ncbi:ORF1 [Pine marten torque teno virus 1]|uniref:Capsid protein n=1 Tax=Pine marten torque teno virus 1 TaxID=1128423 RepID=G9ITT1_9VIRU|nr:ORF1 [Pine marten torque teno virus 1]AEW87510.1 ORF1 [Pine marten torque teno virus 1]